MRIVRIDRRARDAGGADVSRDVLLGYVDRLGPGSSVVESPIVPWSFERDGESFRCIGVVGEHGDVYATTELVEAFRAHVEASRSRPFPVLGGRT